MTTSSIVASIVLPSTYSASSSQVGCRFGQDLVAALELLVAADAGSAAPSASASRTQKMDRVVRFMINWISYELPRQPDEGQARTGLPGHEAAPSAIGPAAGGFRVRGSRACPQASPWNLARTKTGRNCPY